LDPNPVELFIHVFGVLAVFVGYGTLLLATFALRRAARTEDVRAIAAPIVAGRRIGFEQISVIDLIVVAGVLLIAVTGFDMGRTTGDLRTGWAVVAIASFLLIAPVGPLVINPRLHAIARSAGAAPAGPVPPALKAQLHDAYLTFSLRCSFVVLVGLVFLMTVKPSIAWSVASVLTALGIGAIWGLTGRHR
jgi:predicted integral membrane protein DUF2269